MEYSSVLHVTTSIHNYDLACIVLTISNGPFSSSSSKAMDPITIISALASFLAIIEGMVKISKWLSRYLDTAVKASQHTTFFFNEISNFNYILNSFYDHANNAKEDLSRREKRKLTQLIKNMASQCLYIGKEAKAIKKIYAKIHQYSSTKLRKIWAQVRWSFIKPDMEELLLCMNTVKSSASFMTTHLILKRQKVEAADSKIINILKDQLKVIKKQVEQDGRVLEAYRQRQQIGSGGASNDHLERFLEDNVVMERFVHRVVRVMDKERARTDEQGAQGRRGPSPPQRPTSSPGPSPRRPPPPGPQLPGLRDSTIIPEERNHSTVSEWRDSTHMQLVSLGGPTRDIRNNQKPPQGSRFSSQPRTRPQPASISGPRIRDNGTQITEEFGEWPTATHYSNASSIAPSPSPSPSAKKPPERNLGDKPADTGMAQEIGQPNSARSSASSNDHLPASSLESLREVQKPPDFHSPWQPVPPFTSQGPRRRRRRPRTSSASS
ncbi:hypothetical protein BKA67DRAFT_646772, partial [Truncatella angustata]